MRSPLCPSRRGADSAFRAADDADFRPSSPRGGGERVAHRLLRVGTQCQRRPRRPRPGPPRSVGEDSRGRVRGATRLRLPGRTPRRLVPVGEGRRGFCDPTDSSRRGTPPCGPARTTRDDRGCCDAERKNPGTSQLGTRPDVVSIACGTLVASLPPTGPHPREPPCEAAAKVDCPAPPDPCP